jgi:hypothetical protein
MLMDLAFDHIDGGAQAPGPFPRVHARNPRAAARAREKRGRRPDPEPVAEAIAARRGCSPSTRWWSTTRRRDDPVAAVRANARARGEGRHHLQPAAARPLQGRAQPRAVPAVHRPDRARCSRWSGQRPDRLPARPARRRRPGHVPNGPEATAALSAAFFQLTDYPVEDRAKVPSRSSTSAAGGRLHVPKSLKGVAVFSFKRLCGEPRGAADYLAIARASTRDHRRHSGDGPATCATRRRASSP